jgi:predicted dehydrogenase
VTALGAAVVGLGVGEQHAAAYARLPETELRWVHDLDRSRAERAALELGARVAESEAELLADAGTDLVSIASFDDAHFGQVVSALRAGKHVFVEKPLCRSADEVRAVKEAWEASGRCLASNLVLRAAPAFTWLRDAIAAGELGEVYAIDGDYLYGRLHKLTDGWRRDVENYSVMLGGGVHLVDLVLWLTGQRPDTVAATGNRISTEGTDFRHLDYVAATYRFPSGLLARISANFGSVHRHQHVVRVYGTRATFVSDDAGVRLHRDRDDAAEPVELAPLPASKAELIPGFVRAILDGERGARAQVQREFDVISACVAADRALQEGGAVDIEYA